MSCQWQRTEKIFEGYPGLIHGGVTASLVDELMANTVWATQNKFGVTLKLKLFYHGPVQVGDTVYGHTI